MRTSDRHRFIEQTVFFPTPSFADEYHEEAHTYVDDHVLRLRRLHPGMKVALAFEHDCDGEAYFTLLMSAPDDFVTDFENRATKLWAERLPRNASHTRRIDPVVWLEEISCGPFSQTLHVDDAIWTAYYFRMDKEFWSPGASNFR